MPSAESEPHQPAGGTPGESQPGARVPPGIARWVKTECGRAKYQELASRPGPLARLRLWWFVLIASLRDCWPPLPTPPS